MNLEWHGHWDTRLLDADKVRQIQSKHVSKANTIRQLQKNFYFPEPIPVSQFHLLRYDRFGSTENLVSSIMTHNI